MLWNCRYWLISELEVPEVVAVVDVDADEVEVAFGGTVVVVLELDVLLDDTVVGLTVLEIVDVFTVLEVEELDETFDDDLEVVVLVATTVVVDVTFVLVLELDLVDELEELAAAVTKFKVLLEDEGLLLPRAPAVAVLPEVEFFLING